MGKRMPIKLTHPLLRMIRRRLFKQNRNFLVLVLGETGSGKSYLGLRLCQLIDPRFGIANICMNTYEFVERINAKIKKGAALLYEELGVSADSAEWWSLQNKILKYISQVFRTDNLAVFFTVPDDALIDKSMKLLFHAFIETHHIDYAKKVAYFRMYRYQKNQKTGKIYKKYYRFWEKDAKGDVRPYKYSMFSIHIADDWLVDAYEIKRNAFTQQLKEDMLSSLQTGKYRKFGRAMHRKKAQLKKKEDQTRYDRIAQRIAENPKAYTTDDGRPIMTKIRADFALGIVNAQQVWRAAKDYMSQQQVREKTQ